MHNIKNSKVLSIKWKYYASIGDSPSTNIKLKFINIPNKLGSTHTTHTFALM